jgi:aspartyl-tRNA(Asn)/glutamyl-tRNA(Gln) amidotransferase subunit C
VPGEIGSIGRHDGEEMKITKQEVLHVADLAHLEMGAAEVDRFAEQIGQILEYVDTLNQVDTRGVPGTSHAISLTNAFREDVEVAHLDRERALSNAPQKEDGDFVVPKVVG